MNKLLIGAAAAALAAGASVAIAQTTSAAAPPSAQPPAAAPQMRVRMMSDRVMTRDEMVEHVRKIFARLDTNRDGYVTREEADAGEKGMMEMHHRFAEGDMPMPDRAAAFARLDANHDGMISRDEFMAARPEIREERIVMKGGPDGDMGKHMHGAGMHFGMAGHLFEMADANHDGKVSLAEATDAAARHFDQADLNHDGKLTPDERRQAHRAMHPQPS